MKAPVCYPPDELERRMRDEHQSKRWYIRHHSPEMRDDYRVWCRAHSCSPDREDSATAFLDWLDDEVMSNDVW